ncbi:MAG: hypothetical protein WEC79_09270 [Thermomicrobiales bacterium]
MAIRPPRATRRPRRSRLARDLIVVAIVATVVILFALRCLMALFGIETWTAAWRIVDAPTGLLVSPLENIEAFAQTPVGDLTLATLAVTAISFVAALVVLGTLANRRD